MVNRIDRSLVNCDGLNTPPPAQKPQVMLLQSHFPGVFKSVLVAEAVFKELSADHRTQVFNTFESNRVSSGLASE